MTNDFDRFNVRNEVDRTNCKVNWTSDSRFLFGLLSIAAFDNKAPNQELPHPNQRMHSNLLTSLNPTEVTAGAHIIPKTIAAVPDKLVDTC